ncbi:uncharacterized protein [Watersipora subatra]|uniref:uncharacterized protein n=1 Tax=Watersipora subatra TaxID=2589382 RepID=UPI00355B758D
MRLWNICKKCFQERSLSLRLQSFVPVRGKVYGKRTGNEPIPSQSKDVLVYVHKKWWHVGVVMSALTASGLFLYTTALTFEAVGQHMRDVPAPDDKGGQYGRFRIDMFKFREGKYHKMFAYSFYVLAMLPILAVLYIPPRYIKALVLLKDKRNLVFTTYAPFGKTKHVTVPITKVSSSAEYQEGKPLFIRSSTHRVPFYMSSSGEVTQVHTLNHILERNRV